MIKFFRNVRKSKFIPTLLLIVFLVFFSYKLGQLFSQTQYHDVDILQLKTEGIFAKSIEERLEPWVETVSWHPRVQVMHNLLTVKECEEIIALGESKLARSEVVGEGGKNVESMARTSDGLFYDNAYMIASPLLRNIEYRIAKWTQVPRENGECFYLLRYKLGQQYVSHLDYFGEHGGENVGSSGDRIATVLVYLRTPEEGGETNFPRSHSGSIKVAPIAGDAVLFWNFHPDGTPDDLSLHAGLPVIKGTKFSITKWIRAKKTEFSWIQRGVSDEELEKLNKEDEIYEELHGLHFRK